MKYVIDKSNSNICIRDYLRKLSFSNALIKRLKRLPNGILVNLNHQTVRYILKENDILKLCTDDFESDTNEYLEPVDLHFDIIYEDENYTVVNKPGNMPTHQSLNNHNNTLANALMHRYKGKNYVFRAINRLDKDTSGVVVTANNRYYASLLSNKIKEGKVVKEYVAIVSGRLEGSGVINASIDRVGKSIIKRHVCENGDEAITEYKAVYSSDEVSVVLVYPKTGRTHQIRVHMAHIGHPIIGDSLYFEKSDLIDRQALHCLSMNIEGIGVFQAPLPNDMENLLRRYFGDEKLV